MAGALTCAVLTAGMLTLGAAGCGSARHSLTLPTRPTAPAGSAVSGTGSGSSTTPSSATTSGGLGTALWPSYHATRSRSAAVAAGPSLDPATRAWSADLGGAVYGQPVVADGRIFAATENDRVVALDPRDGKILWSTSLGAPLNDVASVAGCGDIDPLGVTSTPAIDSTSGVLYVVGEVSTGAGAVHHQLEGLKLTSGSVVLSEDVDPPLPAGENPVNLLQRASLALGNGRVYIGYGGNFGDCGDYHGWVVGVNETGAPHEVFFEVAADGEGGGVWESGGAPALDAQGDLFITTGNANPDPPQGGPDPKKYTESVVKLTPALAVVASFKDRVAGGDEDLATGSPVLLPDGDVFAVGKTDIGYVLTQSKLALVGTIPGICGSDPDGGPAYDAATNEIFVPCRGGGIQEVNLTADRLGRVLSGANSAPILVGGDLWAAEYPDGTLFEYDAARSATLQELTIGSPIPNFASPSSALGLLLVSTARGVTAFDGPGGLPASVPG